MNQAEGKAKEALLGGDAVFRKLKMEQDVNGADPSVAGMNADQLKSDAIVYEHPEHSPETFDLVSGDFLFGKHENAYDWGMWAQKQKIEDSLDMAAGKVQLVYTLNI